MICPKCSAMNPDGAKFCTECGAPLTAPAQPQDNPLPYNGQPYAGAVQQPQNAQQPYGQPYVGAAPQPQNAQQPYGQPYAGAAPQPQNAQQPYGQPYAGAAPQQQNIAQPPYGQPCQAPAQQQNAGATPPDGQPPKKRGKTALIAVIVIAVLVIGGVLCAKFFGGGSEPTTAPVANETTTAAEDATQATDAVTTAADPTQTTEGMNGTSEQDLSVLYGEWVDQGGVYDLYIRPDGAFFFAMPEGLFTGGIITPGGPEYGFSVDLAPASLQNAVVTLGTDGGTRCLDLRADGVSVTLDFLHVPEKDEYFDWMALGYASEYEDYYDYYDECIVDQSLYSAGMMMIANYPLFDVKLLSLEVVDVFQDGQARFKTQELYSQPVLLNRRPLRFEVNIAGDIPTRGVSFVDLEGVTHYYAVSYSGYDGSVVYEEFAPY